jgi:hypothetical protein
MSRGTFECFVQLQVAVLLMVWMECHGLDVSAFSCFGHSGFKSWLRRLPEMIGFFLWFSSGFYCITYKICYTNNCNCRTFFHKRILYFGRRWTVFSLSWNFVVLVFITIRFNVSLWCQCVVRCLVYVGHQVQVPFGSQLCLEMCLSLILLYSRWGTPTLQQKVVGSIRSLKLPGELWNVSRIWYWIN